MAPVWAAPPLAREGKPRWLTSLAAYSFRDTFHKEPEKFDLFKFVDFCADQGLAGAEVTSYYFPEKVDEAYLLRLKRHAFLRGVALSGTAVGNNFALPQGPERGKEIAHVKEWILRAAVLGAPHIRVFAGAAPQGTSAQDAEALCIDALTECAQLAAAKGVYLGVENHGGIVAEPEALVRIVEAVKSDWVGINLDSGNFRTADPYASLALCAPYAVNAQVKVEIHPKDSGKVPLDYSRFAEILRKANYQGFVALEYESSEDAWAAVPKHLAELKKMCAPSFAAGKAE